ncbi:MAG: IS3 family transposase [Anaerolineales bacterium]|nr:IS3 family transposase [Anaerolineales bacterium]
MVCPGDRQRTAEVFRFIKANQASYPIQSKCRVLEVSRSGYYAWLKRPLSERAQEDATLTERVRELHDLSRKTYGAPRIPAALARAGIRVGRKRVARLMKAANLRGVSRRKHYVTTRRAKRQRPASDLVERNFTAKGADQLWVADITYVTTWAGPLYLAVVMDAWSRCIVGWAMATHLRTQLVINALRMAIRQRRPTGVIHHSDQGYSIHPWILAIAVARPASSRRWVQSETATTTPCVRACWSNRFAICLRKIFNFSTPPWSVNCLICTHTARSQKQVSPYLASSKVGIILIGFTRRSTIYRQSNSKEHMF